MTRLQVIHVATGRSMIGTPDELLEYLGGWWPEPDSEDSAVDLLITQAVYEWERGVFDGWRTQRLGVRAAFV